MSQIKLLHSGGNGVIIAAPDSNPASDRTLKLPSDVNSTIDTLNRAGNILQVVKSQKTDAASSTTINAFTDIISNCVTITPAASGNKIFGTFSFSFGSSVVDHLINFRIVRDSTVVSDVGDTTSGFAYFATTQGMRCLFDANGGNFLTLTFFDTAVDTNAHTYKLQYFRSQAGTTYINRTHMIVGGTNYASTYGGIGASTFTVMEIAA